MCSEGQSGSTASAPLGFCCRFLRCSGYRRVILDDHLRTLGRTTTTITGILHSADAEVVGAGARVRGGICPADAEVVGAGALARGGI